MGYLSYSNYSNQKFSVTFLVPDKQQYSLVHVDRLVSTIPYSLLYSQHYATLKTVSWSNLCWLSRSQVYSSSDSSSDSNISPVLEMLEVIFLEHLQREFCLQFWYMILFCLGKSELFHSSVLCLKTHVSSIVYVFSEYWFLPIIWLKDMRKFHPSLALHSS